jgi:DNA repair protein RadC
MQYVKSSYFAFGIIMQCIDHEQLDLRERFWMMYLNNANGVLGIAEVGSGCTDGVSVPFRYIFQLALSVNAVAMIAIHNHPSGKLRASQSDKVITEKLKTAGTHLNIRLIDHLIITSENYLSFADEHLL